MCNLVTVRLEKSAIPRVSASRLYITNALQQIYSAYTCICLAHLESDDNFAEDANSGFCLYRINIYDLLGVLAIIMFASTIQRCMIRFNVEEWSITLCIMSGD